jgi:hypothetical protein
MTTKVEGRQAIMGWIDKHGRPELVVHPDILAGRAVYRPAGDTPTPPTGQRRRTRPATSAQTLDAQKQAARTALLAHKRVEAAARAAVDNAATNDARATAQRHLATEEAETARLEQVWLAFLAIPTSPKRRKTGDIEPPDQG